MTIANPIKAKAKKASKPQAKKGGKYGLNLTAAKAKAPEKTKKASVASVASVKPKASVASVKPWQSYSDLLPLVSLPIAERKPIAIGRQGEKIIPRSFHLSPERLEVLKAQYKDNPKEFPNPQNRGLYGAFIDALTTLGKDKAHSFKAVKEAMKASLSDKATIEEGKTAWQRFAEKEGKGGENSFTLDQRLQQNAEVLQRLGGFTPYGLKLLQVGTLILKSKGAVIDILKGKDGKEKLYRLNTNSNTPVNEFRRRRQAK